MPGILQAPGGPQRVSRYGPDHGPHTRTDQLRPHWQQQGLYLGVRPDPGAQQRTGFEKWSQWSAASLDQFLPQDVPMR